MNILQNYILREVLVAFLISLFLFTFVLLVGNLVKLVELVMTRGVDFVLVAKLFFYLMPYLLKFTIPLSFLTGTVFVFGRLSANREIVAMQASGIRLFKLTFPVVVFGLLLSMGAIVLNNHSIPKAHFAYRKLLKEIGAKSPTSILEAGSFIEGFGDYILFIYDIDKGVLKNIRIYQPQENRPPRIIIAKRGEIITSPDKNIVTLKLTDGTSDEPNPQNPESFYKLNFKTYRINLRLSNVFQKDVSKKGKDMSFKELLEKIERYQNEKIDAAPLVTEIHMRLAMAFSSLVFVLIGLPLAIRTGRSEKSINFAICLAIAFVYWILMALGEALSVRNVLPPMLAMWFPNILLAIIGFSLSIRVLEGHS
ncbi:MAG: LptF/LptG family permease [Candidatus Omnitrophota bacterium]